MKYQALVGLASLATQVAAHPQRRQPKNVSKRGVDLSSFPVPVLSDYTSSRAVPESEAQLSAEDYVETAKKLVEQVVPGAEFRVVEDHYVSSNGVAHVNLKQTAHGVDIDNADFNVNIRNGKAFSYGNSFYTGEIPSEPPLSRRDVSDPVDALRGVISTLGLGVDASDSSASPNLDGPDYTISGTSGAVSDPTARLVYMRTSETDLKLTWRVETDVLDNWLLSYVDAVDTSEIHGVLDYVSDIATYEVYPWGINDPTEGEREVIEDPWLLEASPLTWISDGTTNYTTTRGNNGIAQNNPSGGSAYLNNYRPDSPDLKFEYPFSLAETDPTKYVDASITQIFYTASKYHDLLYTLGFTEEAGNFQVSNNGAGGVGNDEVILNTQDGSGTDNANFATPPDGQRGRMRMYLFTQSTPRRDSSFEAGVVIHEFTHGLSNRLTGGPANSGCLPSGEPGGMGEGWSDFYATAIRLKPADTRETDYPMGAWVDNNPGGIRLYPYSTSLDVNPLTYQIVDDFPFTVHAIGTVWNSILYEVLWNLIDKHGKNDADFPEFDADGVPTDGKYLAMKLVLDGLALQPCRPTFVNARDGIIDADEALTGGANACELWTGFAKRGLGANASSSPRSEDFTVPDGVC